MEKTTSGKIDELKKRNSRLMTMGGEKMVAKQRAQGKLTARERIALLFDEGTFQETQIFVKHRSTLFGLGDKEINADGVVTGYGRVTGRIVFAAAQDFTSAGGSLGEMHAKKIWKVMEMAADARKPFIALNDSGGARIQEGITALQGYSGIFFRNTIASGYIPQISAIMGPTAGGAVYSPALNDFVFMVKNKSYMYLTGPDVVKAVIAEEVSHEELGGAMAHAAKSGVCHFVAENDEDCIRQVKVLLSYLPDSCHSPLPVIPCEDSAERECPELDTIIPDQANRSYDIKKVIASVADSHDFFEVHEHWAKNMVVGFIRIMGRPVGIIANNPRFFAGVLDVNSADKSARFVRFCDAFNIPILTFTDVPGFMPGTQQEWSGVIRHGAKLLHAYSEATVPLINVVTRKSYGGGYNAMCSKDVGADYVMAWPSAEIAVMGAEGACNIIYRREIAEAPDPAVKRAELAGAYEEQFNNPYFAATLGIIDEIIVPRETRRKVIALLEALQNKAKKRLEKKHNNIPL